MPKTKASKPAASKDAAPESFDNYLTIAEAAPLIKNVNGKRGVTRQRVLAIIQKGRLPAQNADATGSSNAPMRSPTSPCPHIVPKTKKRMQHERACSPIEKRDTQRFARIAQTHRGSFHKYQLTLSRIKSARRTNPPSCRKRSHRAPTQKTTHSTVVIKRIAANTKPR